jgi:D-alanine-D-alanine ligase
MELRARLEGRRRELGNLRIAVLAGGGSNEREVSLRSGRAVLGALQVAGYNAQLLELGADNLSLLGSDETRQLPATTDGASLLVSTTSDLTPLSAIRAADVVLTMLHGSHGENGAWQGLLELAGVPFVSAEVKGSALAMDKVISKRLFEQLGLPTPRWWLYFAGEPRPAVPAAVTELVAKPPTEGSSVGIVMANNDEQGWAAIDALTQRFDQLLIEERIRGRELTVGIIGPSRAGVVLPPVEILAGNEFYDFEAKYGGVSNYVCPAVVDAGIAARISRDALRIYQEFELGPYARIDCLLRDDDSYFFLEANTLPGFTEHSLLPMAAQAAGVGMIELLELLMLCALERHEQKERACR